MGPRQARRGLLILDVLRGETAEHAEVLRAHEYDLSGSGVGVVDEADVLGAHRIQLGDVVVAMNYFVKDGVFYMTSYGKAQKVVNIRRNPKVALMIEEGNAYSELRGVMVRGHCEIIEGADAVRAAFAEMARARGAPPGRPQGASDSAPKRVVLKIVPEKVTTWDHGKLGGVY